MIIKRLLVWVLAGSIAWWLGTAEIKASEGTVELVNVANGSARCFAASVLMQDFNYKIIVSCRDLIYPGNTDVFDYSLWAQETGGDKIHKLGSLGFGKAEFRINKPFSRLFVTMENSGGARKPSDRMVMNGEVRQIPLLEQGGVVSTPTQEVVQPSPSPTPEDVPFLPTVSDESPSRFSALKLVGGIFVGLVVFVVIIALISASRRRPLE